MVFSDTLFLLLFLPVLLVAHFLGAGRFRNGLLLAASLTFYAIGEGVFVALMLGYVAVNWALGIWLFTARGHARKRILTVGVTANLFGLTTFKYSHFLADNLNVLMSALHGPRFDVPATHLPIGISFFTFECVSYLVDIYRRDVPAERNPLNLALFVALFPHLVAGPILRYADLSAQIRRRTVSLERFARGAQRFSIGLGKKVLIADPAASKADWVFALPMAELSSPVAWLGIVCYTIQIYFDFSGYSDMAIGLGRMFGFELCENFNYPYVARSVTDFWRRWHISLSTWFRDYLYIPLGGNRLGPMRTYFNLALVFVLCGLWHGASWNFLIWGALHGVFLVIERAGLGSLLKSAPRPLGHSYTLLVVVISWVFFRAETLTQATTYLTALAGLVTPAVNAQPFGYYLDGELLTVVACALLGCTSAPKRWLRSGFARLPRTFAESLAIAGLGALLLASLANVAAGSYSPFIYLRF